MTPDDHVGWPNPEAEGTLSQPKVQPKTFGPMHGERTRRHQIVSDGIRRGTIVSIYEVDYSDELPDGHRLNVELMRMGSMGGLVAADLTFEEVRWLRDACNEFLNAWGGERPR